MRQRKQQTRESFAICKAKVLQHYAGDTLSSALAASFFYQPNALAFSPEIFRLQVAKDKELKAMVSDPDFDLREVLRPIHHLFLLHAQEIIQ